MDILDTAVKQAMGNWDKMLQQVIKFNENMDASHDQEIRAYIEKAVADIARKCGVDQSEVWAEMEYWSRDKR